jgi:hypothetical protein
LARWLPPGEEVKTIIAHSLEMAESDVLKYVDRDALNQIKNLDDHPQFSAYAIGHEGESGGDLTIQGQRVRGVKKKWLNDAIQSLYEKIKAGTKVFHLHAQTNEHEGRRSIGQVVGKALEKINDKLTAIVITYIEPAARAMGLDVASMEADLRIDTDGDSVVVSGIDEVTGIALASSKFNRPGFPGATLLATVQELATGGNNVSLTVEEVSAWLRENKIAPSQVFSNTKLKEDPVIETIIEKETAQEFKKRRIAEEALEDGKAAWEKEKKTLADEAKTYKVKAMSGEISQKAKDLMTQRKLDEDQIAYLSDFIQDFTIDDPTQIESALNKKLDDGLKKYVFHAEKVFKVKKEAKQDGGGSDNGTPPEPGRDDDIKQSAAYKELSV